MSVPHGAACIARESEHDRPARSSCKHERVRCSRVPSGNSWSGTSGRVFDSRASPGRIDAQDPELRLWLRIEEVTFDKSPDADFWKRPTARAVVIADLAALVARMVAESGSQEGFDAKSWVLDWLTRSHPAFGNRCPEELLDTEEGRRSLREILGRMQSGVYS